MPWRRFLRTRAARPLDVGGLGGGPSCADSDMAEPPGSASGLDPCEPATGDVQQGHGYRPDEIEPHETPSISVGRVRIAHGMIREQPRIDVPRPDHRHADRQEMDERNV